MMPNLGLEGRDVQKGQEELLIDLGRTWSGREFLKLRKLKRKPGYRAYFLERRWGGFYRTLWTWAVNSADEVVEKLRQVAGLVLSEEDEERLRQFFKSCSAPAGYIDADCDAEVW